MPLVQVGVRVDDLLVVQPLGVFVAAGVDFDVAAVGRPVEDGAPVDEAPVEPHRVELARRVPVTRCCSSRR
jgi:hypothetical protein